MTAERAAFERAVADYRLTDLAPPDEALAVAAASLDRTGLFLLGEVHGVALTPCAILGIAQRLGVRALAFEWSLDELDDVVQPVLSTGRVASDALWRLPPSAEVFSGDGHGEHELPSGELPTADVVVPVGVAYPAVVPHHPLGST